MANETVRKTLRLESALMRLTRAKFLPHECSVANLGAQVRFLNGGGRMESLSVFNDAASEMRT
jgi:hypothetical protein